MPHGKADSRDLRALVVFAGGDSHMINRLDVFHFDANRPSFESYAKSNGFKYWLASHLLECLSYSTMTPILKAVNNAIAACATFGIPINENFQEFSSPEHPKDLEAVALRLLSHGDERGFAQSSRRARSSLFYHDGGSFSSICAAGR
jgi:hypothetical protein